MITPICRPLSPGGFSTRKFPILNSPDPVCWNIPYLTLARLPALNRNKPSKLAWIKNHFGLVYSDREIAMRGGPPPPDNDPIPVVKRSIEHLIALYTGLGGVKRDLFELKGADGASTFIFPTDLRLDLSSHTIVLDCCVMPVTKRVVREAAPHLENLSSSAVRLTLPPREHRAWSSLIPAFVERCRTWKHSPACEYKTNDDDSIPASDHHQQTESHLCSCALGNPSEEFLKRQQWHPFARFVARAAISPLFAVPWMEAVGHRKMLEKWLLRRMMEEGLACQCN